MGVAIRMHLEIHIEPRRDSVDIMVEGEGADFLPADESNLVIRSMNAFFDHVGRRPPGYAVAVKNPIPVASGLGGRRRRSLAACSRPARSPAAPSLRGKPCRWRPI